MKKVVYLHGFSSGVNSFKALRLQEMLNEYEFHVLDYPPHQPKHAVEIIKTYISGITSQRSSIILMGSSLGGYYAQYLGSLPGAVQKVILINPALQPLITLRPYLGMHRNMVTGELFNFLQSDYDELAFYDVSSLSQNPETLVLLDKGDDVIDYRHAKRQYQSQGRVICYPGGSHWFEHLDEALQEIRAFCHK